MKIIPALLGGILLLAGCADSDSAGDAPAAGGASSSTARTPSATPTETGVTVNILLERGKATPRGERVEVGVGQEVTLNVISDADEEIHVHSDPEHTYEVTAGDEESYSFSIDTPGQVAVEAHHLDLTIVQLVVRP